MSAFLPVAFRILADFSNLIYVITLFIREYSEEGEMNECLDKRLNIYRGGGEMEGEIAPFHSNMNEIEVIIVDA